VKLFFASFLFLTFYFSFSQEMESDLYASLNKSSLSIFMKTEFTSMSVVTYRKSSKLGLVEEHTTSYRKGKINPERVNFTISYTEFFVLEDRKKSLGKYELNSNSEIFRYERSDFNQRNIRTYTFYHYYIYVNFIVQREQIRIKEYLGTGSVEVDTLVTKDSVIYNVTAADKGFQQKNIGEGGATSVYELDGTTLVKETCLLTGFSEETIFIYDANNQLVLIESSLIGEEGQRITNYTKIQYSITGLITEVNFYDQKNELLEKKVFTYK